MNVGSLFTGCYGLDLGLEAAGFETVWACESDDACRRVLERQRPGLPIIDDVRDVSTRALKKLTQEQVEEAVDMYGEGWSCAKLGERYGVTRQAMWDLLRRRTTLRPRERHGEDNHFYRGGRTASSRAHDLLEQALKDGVVQRRDTCETCGKKPPPFKDGRSAVQAHHDDYNKPLKVRWLCQPCHHACHREHRAVEEVRSAEVPEVDLLAGGFPL